MPFTTHSIIFFFDEKECFDPNGKSNARIL
jgi:hypothetical protein